MNAAQILKKHELFQGLTSSEAEVLAGASDLRSCAKEHVIFEHDAKGTHVFLLLEGRVRLWIPTATGEYSVVAGQIGAGDLFGLSPLLGSARYTTSAKCAGPCEVLAIEAGELGGLMRANPVFGRGFLDAAARSYFARYTESLRRLQNVLNQIVWPG